MATVPHIDSLLSKTVGHRGKYRKYLLIALYLHRIWVAWHQLAMLIVAPNPGKFICMEPMFERCDDDCPAHLFDLSVWDKTIIYEWNLVCSRAWIASTTQAMVMFGILIGNAIFDVLGERFGRKKPLFCACVLQLSAGLATAFVKNLHVYIVLRFLTTVGTGGTMVPSFALLMEFTEKRYRTAAGVLFMLPINVAQAMLGLIGYYARSWDIIHLIIAIPSSILLLYIFLPESPRWLLTQKKTEKCIKVLERGAICNKLPTAHIRGEVETFVSKLQSDGKKGGNCMDLMRTKRMRLKTLIMCTNWAITSMEFYALAQFIGQIGGNVFINIAIGGAIQMPAIILSVWLINAIGRKWTVISGYIIITIPMGIICVLPATPNWPITALACLAVCGSSMNFALMYVYSGELFPTILRSLGMGLCSMSGRVGSMIAPFIMQLQSVQTSLPPLIFSIFPALAIALTLLLPETKNKPLPDTVADADLI